MRIRAPTFVALVIMGFAVLCVEIVSAQAPARGPAGSAPQGRGAAGAGRLADPHGPRRNRCTPTCCR